MQSFTVDCIASAGFGVEAGSFSHPDGEFRRMVMKATGGSKPSLKSKLSLLAWVAAPRLAKALNLKVRDEESFAFFADVMRKSMKHRFKNSSISSITGYF